ncbi:MAG: hypothetical protein QXX70_02265, partial [Candidatus Micrarchaeaceae archaeon]
VQGSLNFSEFMRREISKFGVGQAAVDMSFQTNVEFPEIFLIDRIIGEVPLDVYTINVADILSQSELNDESVQKEYFLEKADINAKLIENNIGSDVINEVFKQLDAKGRLVDIRSIVQMLLGLQASKEAVVGFLRAVGMPDSVITRAFVYVT